MKKQILIILIILSSTLLMNAQTLIGTNPNTQIKVYEFFHHYDSQEWLKVCSIDDDGWSRGGVSGLLFYNNYHYEGSGFVEYTFPRTINSDQKPVIILHGNAANDFTWYIYKNVNEEGKNIYDIFILTPAYHVGFTFLMRGYSYVGYCSVASPPAGTMIWNSNDNQETIVFYNGNGNIGFGTMNPSHKLDVNGSIRANEVVVNTTGADFVFDKDYKLPELSDIEKFIQENNHLPDMASSSVMQENGMNVSEMQTKLLQKIEELTLYIIEQNRHIIEQNKRIEILENSCFPK
jgi:hypothetical protein